MLLSVTIVEVSVWQGDASYVPEHLSKEQDIPLAAGDRVRVRTPGGGGYGNPFERPPELVLEDVRLGRYSVEEAREMFGVEIAVPDMTIVNVLMTDTVE